MKIARVKSVNLLQESALLKAGNCVVPRKALKMFIRPKHERNPVLGIFYFSEHEGREVKCPEISNIW